MGVSNESDTTDLVTETRALAHRAGAYFPYEYYWYYSFLRLPAYTKPSCDKRP